MQNLLLTLTVFTTTALSEIIFFQLTKSSIEIPFKNFLGLFVVLFLMSFIKNKWARTILMNLILVLSFFQMMHIEFYSMPIYPNAILLFFTQISEIQGTLAENTFLFLTPIGLIIPALLINFWIDKKAQHLKKSIPFFHILFIFYLAYNPIRTYMTGNTWGRQPSSQELMGTNVYLSISYFLGKILPFKILNKKHAISKYPNVKFSETETFKGNIIFIMGESLSPNHMSLYGYQKPTTPYLDSLKNSSHFKYIKGISNAVSTDVSLALLFNNTYGLNGLHDIAKGSNCLFRLARKHHFQTHFYSTQSTQQLRYITNSVCPKEINHFKTLENIEPELENADKADDHLLIDLLPANDDDLDLNFFVLHQRGSHSPYKLRYPQSQDNFPLKGDHREDRVIHYDNSVLYFDQFFKKLITKIANYKKPLIIIYTSDHGEGLGEEDIWGHAALKSPSFEVPMLFYSINMNEDFDPHFPLWPTHFHTSLMLAKLLGYKSQYSLNEYPFEYKILGNDLDGFAGFLEVNFKDNQISTLQKDL